MEIEAPVERVRTPMLRRVRTTSAGVMRITYEPGPRLRLDDAGSFSTSSMKPEVPLAPASLKTRTANVGICASAGAMTSMLPSPVWPIAATMSSYETVVCAGTEIGSDGSDALPTAPCGWKISRPENGDPNPTSERTCIAVLKFAPLAPAVEPTTGMIARSVSRSEEHTSELQSRLHL